MKSARGEKFKNQGVDYEHTIQYAVNNCTEYKIKTLNK